MDQRHKLVRRYSVTDAARHDSAELDPVLDAGNASSRVWADTAYRSAEIEGKLTDRGFKSHIHCAKSAATPRQRGARNRPLSARE
jgi:IS5 family transposase